MSQFVDGWGSRGIGLTGLLTVVVAGVAACPALAAAPASPARLASPASATAAPDPSHPAPAAATAHSVSGVPPAPLAPPSPAGRDPQATSPTAAKAPKLGPGDTSACTAPTLSQAFLWARDRNWYTLVPGQAPDSFSGAGWTLSRGAHVVTARLNDGQTGSVLDLPSGARAVSPAICVTSHDPAARAIVRNVVKAQGVQFFISYAGRRTWAKPQKTGQFHGRHSAWTPSTRINLIPSHRTQGWQIARFVFVGGGTHSEFQLYDFYVDPRMKA